MRGAIEKMDSRLRRAAAAGRGPADAPRSRRSSTSARRRGASASSRARTRRAREAGGAGRRPRGQRRRARGGAESADRPHRAHPRPARGRRGEDLACRHLAAQGYAILARNFRCRSGEVDVVARDGDVTVFVEVKHRRGSAHGDGHESVTFGKRRRIVRAARLFAVGARPAANRRCASTSSRSTRRTGDQHPPRPRRVRRRRALRADGRARTRPEPSWSGKRDSNPRLRPWQGRTLPLSYSRPAETEFYVSGPRARQE